MKSEALCIFQIGPVQDFIGCARRTEDFWSGSFLLSYLNCVAMHSVVANCGGSKDVIVYPDVQKLPLYEYVSRIEGKEPWEQPAKEQELNPTAPNRFMAILDVSSAKYVLGNAGQQVHRAFKEVALHVAAQLWQRLYPSGNEPVPGKGAWDSLWNRQAEEFFEVYWAFREIVENEPYNESYGATVSRFDARRGIRGFKNEQLVAESGYKCTLCGQRASLHVDPSVVHDRAKLRQFWEDIRAKSGYHFKEGEHLCGVCSTKRLAADYVFRRKSLVPSTSSVAAADFVSRVVCQYLQDPELFRTDHGENVLDELTDSIKTLAKKAGEGFQVGAMPKLHEQARGNTSLVRFSHLEGDWLYGETYDNLEHDTKRLKFIDTRTLGHAREMLGTLFDCVKKADPGNHSNAGPAKYYALLRLDGDDIGEHLSKCASIAQHRTLSRSMAEFSVAEIPRIVEKTHIGKVVYFGGDEGVAFSSLDDLLQTMCESRNCFDKSFEKWKATCCVGAVIAHHQHSLIQVLREAQLALDKAKELQGKDGFCVALVKRSGGVTYARAKWQYGELDVVSLLDGLVGWYSKGSLSDSWWYQLRRKEWGFREIRGGKVFLDTGLIKLEVARLMRRHWRDSSEDLDYLIKGIAALVDGMQSDWDDFLGLMELAAYIARGGGR